MRKIFCLFLFIPFWTSVFPQNINIEEVLLDTIVNRISDILSIEKDLNSYQKGIRIIDLTKRLKLEACFFKEIPCIFKNEIPLNLNNGEYRDIIVREYIRKKNKTIIELVLCTFEANSAKIKIPFYVKFSFQKNKDKIFLLSIETNELDIWDGYFQ